MNWQATTCRDGSTKAFANPRQSELKGNARLVCRFTVAMGFSMIKHRLLIMAVLHAIGRQIRRLL